mmetsp:Transcript_1460/g.3135  ORF Transcript_1460/g.3135 Transcript_1460/m.3135 type:complete len:403 (+) Transcript_1460:315-1523(+)
MPRVWPDLGTSSHAWSHAWSTPPPWCGIRLYGAPGRVRLTSIIPAPTIAAIHSSGSNVDLPRSGRSRLHGVPFWRDQVGQPLQLPLFFEPFPEGRAVVDAVVAVHRVHGGTRSHTSSPMRHSWHHPVPKKRQEWARFEQLAAPRILPCPLPIGWHVLMDGLAVSVEKIVVRVGRVRRRMPIDLRPQRVSVSPSVRRVWARPVARHVVPAKPVPIVPTRRLCTLLQGGRGASLAWDVDWYTDGQECAHLGRETHAKFQLESRELVGQQPARELADATAHHTLLNLADDGGIVFRDAPVHELRIDQSRVGKRPGRVVCLGGGDLGGIQRPPRRVAFVAFGARLAERVHGERVALCLNERLRICATARGMIGELNLVILPAANLAYVERAIGFVSQRTKPASWAS